MSMTPGELAGTSKSTRHKKVLVVGASGLVGSAVVAELKRNGTDYLAIARRQPLGVPDEQFVSLDLQDAQQCQAVFSQLKGITHMVYCALFEQSTLVEGWSDQQQIITNAQMFENVLNNLNTDDPDFEHVTLLQGTKAYGVHVRAIPIPAREDRDELRSQPNFYWEQEAHLRTVGASASWSWTILRPTLIVGGGSGGAMNALPAIGVFAALLKEEGEDLAYPGGGPRIACACDVDLLARAILWSGDTPAAANQTFNVTNGDVYVWENLWPAIADAFNMKTAKPMPRSLHEYCSTRSKSWDTIRQKHGLKSGELKTFVGPSLQYCDYLLRYGETEPGASTVVSTVKIYKAGFTEMMDSEAMIVKWIQHLQAEKLIP